MFTYPIDKIRISHKRLRELDEDTVEKLMASIKTHGLFNPVILMAGRLLGGLHRVEAYKRLGYTEIPFTEYAGDVNFEDELLLVEIDENLIRNELTPEERDQHIALKVKLITNGKLREHVRTRAQSMVERGELSREKADEVIHCAENGNLAQNSTVDLNARQQKVLKGAERESKKEATVQVAAEQGKDESVIRKSVKRAEQRQEQPEPKPKPKASVLKKALTELNERRSADGLSPLDITQLDQAIAALTDVVTDQY